MIGDDSVIYFHKDGYLRGMVTIYFRTHGMDNIAATFKIRMPTKKVWN